PELKYNAALRTFGNSSSLPEKATLLVYGPTQYSTSGFGAALNSVKGSSGTSALPLAKAINAAGDDMKSSQGPIVVIIVSDGKHVDQRPLKAAEAMKGQFGDRVCIDTVQVGDDPAGKMTLQQIVKAGGCGISTTADRLASSANMAGFVEGIFLAKPPPKPAPMPVAKPMDSDGGTIRINAPIRPKAPP
ncbi:MAG: hypothetical protein JRD87_17975, partial [Deltaproteobacteria bacterium]|nr:hypothetical protein [Deltaproteobacteria bacterium]